MEASKSDPSRSIAFSKSTQMPRLLFSGTSMSTTKNGWPKSLWTDPFLLNRFTRPENPRLPFPTISAKLLLRQPEYLTVTEIPGISIYFLHLPLSSSLTRLPLLLARLITVWSLSNASSSFWHHLYLFIEEYTRYRYMPKQIGAAFALSSVRFPKTWSSMMIFISRPKNYSVLLQFGMKAYIPHRSYQVKPHSQTWFTPECASAIYHFYHQHRRNRNADNNIEQYRAAPNHCKETLYEAKSRYALHVRDFIENQKLDSKGFWKIFNSVMNKEKFTILALNNHISCFVLLWQNSFCRKS